MAASPAARALEALLRPLQFAAEEPDSGRARLRDLERSVRTACARARGLAIPRELARTLGAIEHDFETSLEGDARSRAVTRALERLAPYRKSSWSERALAQSVEVLPGVGPRRAETLAKRGLGSVADLLFHLPVGYDDRRALVRVRELEVGRRATFIGEVLVAGSVPSRGRQFRRTFQVVVGDESATVNLKWFRGGDALAGVLKKGARVLVTGEVKRYRFSLELIHPEVEVLHGSDEQVTDSALESLRRIVPEYSTPEGIPPRSLRRWIERAVAEYGDLLSGHLPAACVRARSLPEPAEALRLVHAPESDADPAAYAERRSAAHERLVLEELYLLELGLALRRSSRAALPGTALDIADADLEAALSQLPFRLTGAQRRAWGEIRADLARPHPMNRLLQGDVGSGKTAVAYLAAVCAAASGRQTALMAPTELLAEQHARTLERLAEAAPEHARLRMGLLTASRSRAEAGEVKRALAAGELDLVVGTHALVQPDVEYARLALAIVDEQHRFGVLQRKALGAAGEGGRPPHTLVMTATPIPRTLALTVYGDLDVSVIDELPPGRQPVETHLLRAGEGRRIVELIRSTTGRGEQVYVVYPLVEESEKVDLRAAVESARSIQAAFPECRVDLVHGRLDAAERAEAMARFERGETRILVSTTVIEVGVDVANATLMVIEHAERFGLAQLHQLRGRVGRGAARGTCILVARGSSEDGEARLRAMLETTDGFRIADADLRIRGPGEFLGTRQHGHLPDLRLADLVRDARLVSVAREAALEQVRGDPGLRRDAALRSAVFGRWGDRLELVGVA